MFLVLPRYIFNTFNCSKSLPHRHQREQNYASRREVARIKSKTNDRKEIFHDLLCSNSRSHLVFIGRDDTRVLGVVELCERARSKFLKAKKRNCCTFYEPKEESFCRWIFTSGSATKRRLSEPFVKKDLRRSLRSIASVRSQFEWFCTSRKGVSSKRKCARKKDRIVVITKKGVSQKKKKQKTGYFIGRYF